MEKQIKMGWDEAIEYVKNNVKTYDNLELSYSRVYTPGEVISVQTECLKDRETCSVMVQVMGDTINSAIEVDLEEIKDELIEVRHTPNGQDDVTVITVDRCEEWLNTD